MRLLRFIAIFFKSLFYKTNVAENLLLHPAKKPKYRLADSKWYFPKPQLYVAHYVDDLPEGTEIMERSIYVIGENGFAWLVAFKCPCGCQDFIQLNLLPEASPSWRISQDAKGRISISPSVYRNYRCKSHLIINKGKVLWWGGN